MGEDGVCDRDPGGQVSGPNIKGRHLLSVADLGGATGIGEVLRVAEAFAEVERRSIPKVPHAAGQGRRDPVLRGVHAHPVVVRDRGQAAVGRRALARRRQLVGQEGRESLRDTVETIEAMGIDAVIIRHSSAGAPAPGGALGRARRASSTRATAGTSTPPRRCWTASPCARSWRSARALRPRSWAPPASTGCACSSWATCATAGWPGRRCWPTAPSGPRSRWPPPAACSRRRSRGGRSTVATDLDDALADADVVSLLRLQAERGSGSFVPSLREYTAGWGLTARRVERLRDRRHRHPPRPHGARRRDRLGRGRPAPHRRDPPGGERRGGAHGRPVPAARQRSARAPRRCAAVPDAVPCVIRGGTVVEPRGPGTPDVAVRRRGGRGAWPSPSSRPGRPSCSMPAGCLVGPGLVDLHTHLRAAGTRGGRDGRDRHPGGGAGWLHRGRGHAQHRARRSTRRGVGARGARARRRAAPPRSRWPAPSPWAGPASALAPDRRAGRSGRAALHRRRRRRAGRRAHAPRPRVRQGPRGDPGPALRGRLPGRRRRHARGRLVEPAGPPGHAGRGRGGDGGAGHRARPARPARRSTSCTCRPPARSSWSAGPRRRGCPSRPRRHRTTCSLTDAAVAGYDPVFKVNPPLRTDERRRRRSRPGWPTAPSTPSPPTTRPTPPRPRRSPSTRPRPACSGCRRRCHRRGEVLSAASGARGDASRSLSTAAGRHRRAHGDGPRRAGHSAQGGPVEIGAAANLCVIDPAALDGGGTGAAWPAGAATRPTPARPSTGRVRHTVLRGEPVVIDGEAQR